MIIRQPGNASKRLACLFYSLPAVRTRRATLWPTALSDYDGEPRKLRYTMAERVLLPGHQILLRRTETGDDGYPARIRSVPPGQSLSGSDAGSSLLWADQWNQ